MLHAAPCSCVRCHVVTSQQCCAKKCIRSAKHNNCAQDRDLQAYKDIISIITIIIIISSSSTNLLLLSSA
jgi:hypothetical protein